MKFSPLSAALCASVPLLLALPSALQAQGLYRCGNTYSQTPCAPDATARPIFSGAAPEKAQGLTGYDLCAAAAPAAAGTPEPESARVRQLSPRKAEVIQYAGQGVAAHRYDLGVDAKTRYGVYSGETPFSCWVSEDQARILKFGRRGQ